MRPIFLILIINLIGCGLPKQQKSFSEPPLRLSISMEAERPLTKDELELASDVCNAFRYKRLNYSSVFLGYLYKFTSEEQGCEEASPQIYNVTAQLLVNKFYSYDIGSYFKEFETDTVGLLANICTAIDNNVVPSNSELINSTNIRQFSFTKGDSDEILVGVVYGVKSVNAPVFTGFKSDQMLVLVNSDTQPSWLGMVMERKTREVCSLTASTLYKEKTLYSVFNH